MNLADLRTTYTQGGLSETECETNPIDQFRLWFQQAAELCRPGSEPNAMTLATATPDGIPSARVLLLKGFDERGFVFFTNYESRKGQEIETNPNAAMVFYWPELERQVRVSGTVERVSREESEAYFETRPRESQLGAWASRQSSVIGGREELEAQFRTKAESFNGAIPTPPFWGGYRLIPQSIEFWQGRPSRLHDRLVYRSIADGSWQIERLSP
jgi:pyridoxamine 5'-phosphate oxidase